MSGASDEEAHAAVNNPASFPSKPSDYLSATDKPMNSQELTQTYQRIFNVPAETSWIKAQERDWPKIVLYSG